MARLDLPQSRLRARKRRQKLFASIKIVAALAVVVGLVLGVLWLPHLRVVKVAVTGVEGTAAKTLEAAAMKYISGTYAFIIPKNNILLYPKKSLTAYLYESYPRLAEVQVYAENFRTLGVQVRERVPTSVWCGLSPQSRQPCIFMDEGGMAYEAAAQFSGTVYTEYFGTTTGEKIPKQYLTPESFRSLTALVQAFKDKEGESIARVVVDESEDVRATFTNGFTLLFTAKDDSGDVYARFLLAKGAEPFSSHPLSDFEYLDLRFGDRLYYKLR
jgi:hypothetical protein